MCYPLSVIPCPCSPASLPLPHDLLLNSHCPVFIQHHSRMPCFVLGNIHSAAHRHVPSLWRGLSGACRVALARPAGAPVLAARVSVSAVRSSALAVQGICFRSQDIRSHTCGLHYRSWCLHSHIRGLHVVPSPLLSQTGSPLSPRGALEIQFPVACRPLFIIDSLLCGIHSPLSVPCRPLTTGRLGSSSSRDQLSAVWHLWSALPWSFVLGTRPTVHYILANARHPAPPGTYSVSPCETVLLPTDAGGHMSATHGWAVRCAPDASPSGHRNSTANGQIGKSHIGETSQSQTSHTGNTS